MYVKNKAFIKKEGLALTELKAIIAENIAILRKSKGLTQGELAEKLNYSDKAVSKWERGESVPDIVVLKAIADLFGVTVDYLLTRDHTVYKKERKEIKKRKKSNRLFITLLSVVGVWLAAVIVFLNFDSFLSDLSGKWLTFIYAVPVSAIVAVIFNLIWGKRIFNIILSSLICWSLIASIYLTVLISSGRNMWLLFTLGAPVQVMILLWSRLRFK